MLREPAGGRDTKSELLINVVVYITNPLTDENYLADLTKIGLGCRICPEVALLLASG